MDDFPPIAVFGVRLPCLDMIDNLYESIEKNSTIQTFLDTENRLFVGKIIKGDYSFIKLTSTEINLLEYKLKCILLPFDLWKQEDFGMWTTRDEEWH